MRALPILASDAAAFEAALVAHGRPAAVTAGRPTTLQINVGKLCNMACQHCHVDAGPKRIEVMTQATAERVMHLLARSPSIGVVDITGGAPEMCPSFRWLVSEARRLERRVIDRCNLTVLSEPAMETMAEFLADNEVAVVASLPCYGPTNVDQQRGKGAFDRSIEALQRFNRLGYGQGRGLCLDLVYNPVGPSLPPPQAALEARYREELGSAFGIVFDHLLTITNMPISRFAHALTRDGHYDTYLDLLTTHFNAGTLDGLMCRSLVSIGYDGALYDCDFNQMLDLPTALHGAPRSTIWDVEGLGALENRQVVTGRHCFGCTAGAGSSCSGSLA